LVVVGDSISSFNPVYGQGMSSAALQVQELQRLLRERATAAQGLEGLAQAFFPKATEIIDTPWTLAANQDLAFARTQGERPPDLEERTQYFMDVDALTADDNEVYRLLFEVLNLAKPLSVLREEPLRSRVEVQQRKRANKG
jgi:2-polyprenyl-6-methoxyphenol hydroxylase-like FAD-dependent oxidoreductase